MDIASTVGYLRAQRDKLQADIRFREGGITLHQQEILQAQKELEAITRLLETSPYREVPEATTPVAATPEPAGPDPSPKGNQPTGLQDRALAMIPGFVPGKEYRTGDLVAQWTATYQVSHFTAETSVKKALVWLLAQKKILKARLGVYQLAGPVAVEVPLGTQPFTRALGIEISVTHGALQEDIDHIIAHLPSKITTAKIREYFLKKGKKNGTADQYSQLVLRHLVARKILVREVRGLYGKTHPKHWLAKDPRVSA